MWVILMMSALMMGATMSVIDTSPSAEADPETPNDADDTSETTQNLAQDTTTLDLTTEPAQQGEDAPEGLTLNFNGDATILGGAGDDTLTAHPEGIFGTGATLVDLGAGDDRAQVNVHVDSILGGAGDDSIAFLHPELGNASGGEGDDTLSGIGDISLDGGPGDDVLISDFTDTGLNDNAARALGGSGDDRFIVTKDIAAEWRNSVGGVIATGGAGADTYELNFVYDADVDFVQGPEQGNDPDDSLEGSAGLTITDFDPSEDILRIEVEVPDGETLPTLSSVEITMIDREGFAQSTSVHITLDATSTQPETRTTITLIGLINISAEDIQFVNVSPPVA